MKKKEKNSSDIALKSAGKARREMEIMLYGKPIHRPLIFVDRTAFSRKIKHKKSIDQ